jgi:hydroxyquinol 1,2-dioxygenase
MDFTEETAAQAVVDSFADTPDPRLRELLQKLVPHLHAYVRETRLTLPEWEKAIGFLTAVGQKCDDTRQEFILLSDVLGVSMLTETINGQQEGTESTVLGPFHMTESPPARTRRIDRPARRKGPLRGARSGPRPRRQPAAGCERGRLAVHRGGLLRCPTARPAARGQWAWIVHDRRQRRLPLPDRGAEPLPNTHRRPGGRLAGGHQAPRLPTRAYPLHRACTGALDADHAHLRRRRALPGVGRRVRVKQSLIADFIEVSDAARAAEYGVTAPFRQAEIDIVLEPTPTDIAT